MNLLLRAKTLCPPSVLERVRIIEDFLEEMYENIVGKIGNCPYWRGARIREVYTEVRLYSTGKVLA